MDNKALTNQIISTHNDSIIAALVEQGKNYLLSFNLESHATIKIDIKLHIYYKFNTLFI